MGNLMKAELFKLKKSVGLRVCIIVFLSFSLVNFVFIAAFNVRAYTGSAYFQMCMNSLSGGSVFCMLLGFLAASIITTDYKSRDMQCAIAQGYSRSAILAVKSIIYLSTILLLSFTLMLIKMIGITLINGFGKPFDGDMLIYMLRAILTTGFMEAMTYMTCIFLAFAFTSKAASVALNILVFFILITGTGMLELILDSKAFSDAVEYLPFVAIAQVGTYAAEADYIVISMLVALVWGVLMYLATWAIFRRRNMK